MPVASLHRGEWMIIDAKTGGRPNPPKMQTESNTWSSNVDWTELLSRIQNREVAAVGELYTLISRGVLFLLRRRLPVEEAKDRLHEVFLILIDAVQSGRIADP